MLHGVLFLNAIETAAIAACEANGLMREDGRLAVLATLHKGLARARDDPLPMLNERFEKRNSPRWRAGFIE